MSVDEGWMLGQQVIRDLALAVTERGLTLTWQEAKRVASAERLADVVALQQAISELTDTGAQWVYDETMDAPVFDEDVTETTDVAVCDRAGTNPADLTWTTVNALILRLVALRDRDQSVGEMRVVFGEQQEDVDLVSVAKSADDPGQDVVWLRWLSTLYR